MEIYCVFYDPYGQLVLRKRVPIVSARMGGLKPGETKSFRLPFDELPGELESGDAATGDRRRQVFLMARVLVVDDDAAALEIRKLIFERHGHHVTAAVNAAHAREQFLADPPESVDLDLRLPDREDGLALIREFRAACP